MTSPSGSFCGIDPAAMHAMARDLDTAARQLTAFCADFTALFQANQISTAPLTQIAAIADWGGKQVFMLNSRAEMIKALNGTDDHTFARLPDALDSFERGRGLALMYGTGILANNDFSVQFKGELVHDHIHKLAQLADDPEGAAAFFATLPAVVRDALPNLLLNTGSPTAEQDLAVFSAVLGAARTRHYPGLGKGQGRAAAARRPGRSLEPARAAGRGQSTHRLPRGRNPRPGAG